VKTGFVQEVTFAANLVPTGTLEANWADSNMAKAISKGYCAAVGLTFARNNCLCATQGNPRKITTLRTVTWSLNLEATGPEKLIKPAKDVAKGLTPTQLQAKIAAAGQTVTVLKLGQPYDWSEVVAVVSAILVTVLLILLGVCCCIGLLVAVCFFGVGSNGSQGDV